MTEMTFTRLDPVEARELVDELIVPLYVDTHTEVAGNPFYSAERAAERIRGYAAAPTFEIVIARIDGVPIGQAFGYGLITGRWWEGLTPTVELPEDFTDERGGGRTFAFTELMVLPERQGQGLAHALHDELLRGRAEERATVLTREDNRSAQAAYARWGWRKVGKLQPYPDSPHFDAFVLPLPLPS
ncbi:acetyltransferase (GNAT) family protein [Actinocorallia herbida]|uniref:Acetyltransferase (GNAT) family protein n=1 Tax=Actinocorallia herbida TaxID=58109 RepID=A0A3N1CN25_9ACTN|nr:GNAT family N-acetyltransferase [Actinocorallia herbida]ROO82544.1 acetyltransferase (GNAT) family protein [Actinocorallia herbida]